MSFRRFDPPILLFGLSAFALAGPVYQLLTASPEFLVAGGNTREDAWALALALSFACPLLLALPAILMPARFSGLARAWAWLAASAFGACLVAQLLHSLSIPAYLFLLLAVAAGAALAWLLVYTRWRLLATVLALLGLVFPVHFLVFSGVVGKTPSPVGPAPALQGDFSAAPDIVFILLDEFPVSTLLGPDLRVDERQFPGFARLSGMADFYLDTRTASDGTREAVPAILTGVWPSTEMTYPTLAAHPGNLFTYLRGHYRFNVLETITRLCPADDCGRPSPGAMQRLAALLLDLSAVYAHRIAPAQWQVHLPDVANNWSDFLAGGVRFFPEGWRENLGLQVSTNRRLMFSRFIDSIEPGGDRPGLNFLHLLLPHEPWVYLPDGRNYGLAWVRGRVVELWDQHEWGIASARQRHTLQVQMVDQLLLQLLSHLQASGMLESSLLVVVGDHGSSFLPGDEKRALTDTNAESLVQVPLFIKRPGQTRGRQLSAPASTVDILPTILPLLGAAAGSYAMDGVDLSAGAPIGRERKFKGSVQSEFRTLDLDLGDLRDSVRANRRQLRLDDSEAAIWHIGPLDPHRGEKLASICAEETAKIRFRFESSRRLPDSDPARFVDAHVAGAIYGRDAPERPVRFVITSQGKIVASGTTWKGHGIWRFFAMVKPEHVGAPDWQPEVALLDGERCLTGVNKRDSAD